jgi:hypothetical protein
VLALAILSVPAAAADGEQRRQHRSARERDTVVNGTRLYEVTETVHFGANGLRTTRDAVAVLMGFAPGVGADGTGPVSGTFAVVVNAPGNSSVHVPDLPLMTGTFSGTNDLSPAILHGVPLGSIRGTFKIDGDTRVVPFTGTFRLPFALDGHGNVKEPDDEHEDTFYWGDDGRLISVLSHERVLGFLPVRLEVKF